MKNYKQERFYAVVESGSCSENGQLWYEKENCGHAHKTQEAAEKCLREKQRYYCMHGRLSGTSCKHCLGYAKNDHTSAQWCGGSIHNQYFERV